MTADPAPLPAPAAAIQAAPGSMAMPMPTPPAAAKAERPAGDAPPAPAPPTDHYADRTYGAAAMAGPRAAFQSESGGGIFSQVLLNLAELQLGGGRPAYRWDGEGWLGGDINRLAVRSEGSGERSVGLSDADVQALYSRATGPYFNLQAGARETFGLAPSRTYATVGFAGLAPYWLNVEGALFLSTRGDLTGRLEGYYDQRITQRLTLQPRVELNLAAQDVRDQRLGAGLADAELGLRLRYEIRREVAPYVGVSWDRKVGRTAALVQARGETASATTFVIGVRSWF